MTVHVYYADVDGEEQRISRDTYHTDQSDMLVAHDHTDVKHGSGVENKIAIPLHRVVKVVG